MKKIGLKASIPVFILLMLGFIISLYMFGFTSPFMSELSKEFTSSGNDPISSVSAFLNALSSSVISAFTEHFDEIALPMIGFGLLAGLTGSSYASGNVLRYLIPIMLLFAIMDIFIFPVVPTIEGHVTSAGEFQPLVLILSVVLNCFMFLAILEFVTERG